MHVMSEFSLRFSKFSMFHKKTLFLLISNKSRLAQKRTFFIKVVL